MHAHSAKARALRQIPLILTAVHQPAGMGQEFVVTLPSPARTTGLVRGSRRPLYGMPELVGGVDMLVVPDGINSSWCRRPAISLRFSSSSYTSVGNSSRTGGTTSDGAPTPRHPSSAAPTHGWHRWRSRSSWRPSRFPQMPPGAHRSFVSHAKACICTVAAAEASVAVAIFVGMAGGD